MEETNMPELYDTNLEEVPVPQQAQPTQQQVTMDDLQVGYVVGLTKTGDFVFNILGAKPGLLEVLGLHKHAEQKIARLYDGNHMQGDALVFELGKMVAQLDQKVAALLNAVAPKKPDNAL